MFKFELTTEEIHKRSFDELGRFKELNFEQEFQFIDFFKEEELEEEQYNLLSAFSFTTIVSNSYHHYYFNQMHIELNQLNYGIKRYDIFNDDDLIDALVGCAEFGSYIGEEAYLMAEPFVKAIHQFQDLLYKEEERWKLEFEDGYAC